MNITLTPKDINALQSIIDEIPTKYGFQLVSFFQAVSQRERQAVNENPDPEAEK
jgi:hypothetical protein